MRLHVINIITIFNLLYFASFLHLLDFLFFISSALFIWICSFDNLHLKYPPFYVHLFRLHNLLHPDIHFPLLCLFVIFPTSVYLQCNQILTNSHLILIILISTESVRCQCLRESFVLLSQFLYNEDHLLTFLHFLIIIANDRMEDRPHHFGEVDYCFWLFFQLVGADVQTIDYFVQLWIVNVYTTIT